MIRNFEITTSAKAGLFAIGFLLVAAFVGLSPQVAGAQEPPPENQTEPTPEPTPEPIPTPTPEVPTPTPSPEPQALVVTRPEVLVGEPVVGPNMGWQTCDRAISSDCSGPECGSRSAYYKFYWSDLQWAPDSFDFSIIYHAASQAALMGQQLDLRPVMPYAPEQSAPRFLKDLGVRGLDVNYDDGESRQSFWFVDLNDTQARDHFIALIRALGAHFDSDPRFGIVDIAIFGLWGEGHIGELTPSEIPVTKAEQELFAQTYALTEETRRLLVDAYFEAFPNKLKVAQITDVETLRYAVTRGAGVRLDCFGGHYMERNYTRYLTEAGALDAWKTAPVVAEICGTLDSWAGNWGPGRRQYNETLLQEIFARAESVYHLSSLNTKNTGLLGVPVEIEPQLSQFLTKIGYRFELKEAAHQPVVGRGETLQLKLSFTNSGIAPAYNPNHVIAVRVFDENNEVVMTHIGIHSLAGRLPGDFVIEESVPVAEITPGRVRLAVAVVDKTETDFVHPVMRLAIAGGLDGWYELSAFNVGENAE